MIWSLLTLIFWTVSPFYSLFHLPLWTQKSFCFTVLSLAWKFLITELPPDCPRYQQRWKSHPHHCLCVRLLIWSWNSLRKLFPKFPMRWLYYSSSRFLFRSGGREEVRAAFIFPHKVENFFVNSATTFLTQFFKKKSLRRKKRLTAGAEIFIKRQKKEVLQYLTSEEELFDAAKATVATNREKQEGSLGVPWQICIQ